MNVDLRTGCKKLTGVTSELGREEDGDTITSGGGRSALLRTERLDEAIVEGTRSTVQ